ncbi:hypothetical protein [Pseudomonas trivialis]|uniref:Lipoprotein n=1 Tax=Pseudomonas trivialis TaxID=200450 RepID=A0A0R2Z776_9PSED|nr:hypothetical protein [Pseudomonas trivialis]KRP54449.1 hypothetical protein TU79_24690 [Pseudomonas trivialis]SDS78306.1 hypothetical protein SAMN04490205_3629 [Pseudomonas trivialis]
MKTIKSRNLLLVMALSAVFATPTYAAFGDNVGPAATPLNGGSALPPGSGHGSRSDQDKKKPTRVKTKKPAATQTIKPEPSDSSQSSDDKKPRPAD